jgi:hypothetical protein
MAAILALTSLFHISNRLEAWLDATMGEWCPRNANEVTHHLSWIWRL